MFRINNPVVDRCWTALAASVVALALPDPAWAEVCDKVVGDSWYGTPVSAWDALAEFLLRGLPLLLFGFVLLSQARAIAGYVVGVVMLLLGIHLLRNGVFPDDILSAAYREGCISSSGTIAVGVILGAFGLLYVWIGWRRSLKRALGTRSDKAL